jgi:hypothetical protein
MKAGGGLVEDGEVAIVVGLEGLVGVPVEQAVDAGGAGGTVELDVADAAFDEAAGEQAVAGVGGERGIGVVGAVEVERGLRFAGEVGDFRGRELHAGGERVAKATRASSSESPG